ncbi:MAG: iron-sulfur cluster assembly scaffold protein [Clostridia bacterium]
MYSSKVIEIFSKPKNIGVIKGASGVGKVGNAKCGDIMKMYIKVENNIIVDAKFQTYGCTAAIASSSVATEMIIGKTIEDAYQISNEDVLKVLGELPKNKIHCSMLAEEAIRSAIDNYRVKNDLPTEKTKKKNESN